MKAELIREFVDAASIDDAELAGPALVIARIDYPRLDPTTYLQRLDDMGDVVRERLLESGAERAPRMGLEILNEYLFREQGFTGNRQNYDDTRNSFLNEVMDRRTGIPITLAVIYIEIARRVSLPVRGINFPGHFLIRCDAARHAVLIVDPFSGGTLLSEGDCRQLLQEQVGEEMPFHHRLLSPATKQQILSRMLLNLKHAYVKLRSFPQARLITEMLLGLDPAAVVELRDRGLLAYHLNDFQAALRDLEAYLQLSPRAEADEDTREEFARIWEHVKALRRRIASQN